MTEPNRQCGSQPDANPEQQHSQTVKGFKGFDQNLQCRGFQYEVGKTYEQKKRAKLCASGFHFCEDPIGIFDHYPPTSRFAEVEAEDVAPETEADTKRAARKIHVKAEIKLPALIAAAVKFRMERVDWTNAAEKATRDRGAASATGDRGAASATGNQGAASATGDRGAASATGYQGAASATGNQGAASATGDRGAASATGNRGAASATGDQSAASATGNQGAASATGKEGCAVALGFGGKAKGAKGCWLTLAEWERREGYTLHRIDVQTERVDGKRIKADTFYMLRGGKFVEVD